MKPSSQRRSESLAESYNRIRDPESSPRVSKEVILVLIGLAALLTVGLTLLFITANLGPVGLEFAETPENQPLIISNGTEAANYSTVYETTNPSVVSIYVTTPSGATSQGSGFVYDSAGRIVTNWHVINTANSDTIYVRYTDGTWAEATLLGSDPYTDLSVLRAESVPESATPLPVSDEVPSVGTKVVAIGTPDGLRGSMSVGVVSGVNRSMSTPQGFLIPDMIQTDASLNPGNSGGPLVSTDGVVVGVNRARQGENIGFALSGRVITAVVPTLIQDGRIEHSLIGMRGIPMTPTVAEANGISLRNGILVTEVVEDGPSAGQLEGAGGEFTQYNGREVYKGGDVITAIDGHELGSNEMLTSYLIRETSPGDTVTLTVIRNGEELDVDITLGTRPAYNSSP